MTATLHFDGTNRFITTPALSAMNGSITLAMLVKKEVASNAPLFAFGSESTMPTFYINSSLNIAMYYNVDIVPGVGITLNEWYLIVFTYTPTSGAWQFRIHVKNISTNGAWTHSNWGGPTNIPPSALGKLLRIGTAPGITGPFQGDYGLLAWWDGVILTDVQIESLAANKKTSDWAALSPSMLAEMTAVTPIDLKASAAWTPSGLPLLTGSDAVGWTFDGLGPVVIPALRMFTKAGWVDLKVAYSRTTKIHTTASLAAGASEDSLLTVVPGWRAFKVATSRPARVRVYATSAQRTADASRAVGTNPTGNHGLLFELITSTGLLEYILSPVVDFMADTGSNFYASVTNLDSVAGTVATTYNYVRTE